MATIATQEHDGDVDAFLDAVTDERRRVDARALRELLERVTGAPARMWGAAIVGFGSQPYTNTSGANEWPIVSFSPRKAALTIYGVHDEHGPEEPLLAELGPHTTGKSCLYVKRLDAVDLSVLERLVAQSWRRAHDETEQ